MRRVVCQPLRDCDIYPIVEQQPGSSRGGARAGGEQHLLLVDAGTAWLGSHSCVTAVSRHSRARQCSRSSFWRASAAAEARRAAGAAVPISAAHSGVVRRLRDRAASKRSRVRPACAQSAAWTAAEFGEEPWWAGRGPCRPAQWSDGAAQPAELLVQNASAAGIPPSPSSRPASEGSKALPAERAVGTAAEAGACEGRARGAACRGGVEGECGILKQQADSEAAGRCVLGRAEYRPRRPMPATAGSKGSAACSCRRKGRSCGIARRLASASAKLLRAAGAQQGELRKDGGGCGCSIEQHAAESRLQGLSHQRSGTAHTRSAACAWSAGTMAK